ncbi:MAG TPA: amidohydrolase family protein [Acidimicrobiales bacterium]
MRLTAARVLREDGSLRPGTVTVEGDRIAGVGDPDPGEDLPDRTLAPGLIDLQVNGFGAIDVWAGGPADLDRLGRDLAARGTTAWCPTLTSRALPAYSAWWDEHPDPLPGEIGLHLEGPFLSRAGAHPPHVLVPPDRAWLAALPPRVRIVTLAPELPGALEAISLLSADRLVALGHSHATFEEARAAADHGATAVTHVFNAMAPLGHRQPGLAGAALTDRRLTPMVIGDGVHVHPAVLGLVCTHKPAVLVSDSVAWEGAGLSTTDGAARRDDGTLAGSIITLADAVRVAVQRAGIPLPMALAAASTHPAGLLGDPDRGVLRPGARADLIALDPGLAVVGVWVAGEART